MLWLIVFARIGEACMDAIAFNKGNQKLGELWHWLKYPVFGCWFFAGYFTRGTEVSAFWVAFWILIAYIVFEVALKQFRKINWKDKDWA